jgi:hypothetical protein
MITLITLLLFAMLSAGAQKQAIWAKNATAIVQCGTAKSTRLHFKSPDKAVDAELRCHPPVNGEDPRPYLHLTLSPGHSQDVDLQSAAATDDYRRPQELLWSPDSKAFLVNGGENAYSGFFVDVYRMDGDRVHKVDVTSRAQRDMVATFPPCRAAGADPVTCRRIERDPAFNMSGLAWVGGSSEVAVMAEVPCSSSYGGIMCQVLGYELSATDGHILKRLSATELKHQWQNRMAFDMKIPDPPKYKAPARKSQLPI